MNWASNPNSASLEVSGLIVALPAIVEGRAPSVPSFTPMASEVNLNPYGGWLPALPYAVRSLISSVYGADHGSRYEAENFGYGYILLASPFTLDRSRLVAAVR